MTLLPQVHYTEVDGVPAVWTQVPGPLRAGLTLRVGSADETLVTAGVSHLVEHLALFGVDRPGDHSNGHVEATMTVFHCVGDEATAVDFMGAVTRQLVALPLHRLEVERGILKAEAAGRKSSFLDSLSIWRYGAASYGLAAQDQLGVERLSGDQLQAWAARYATRQNAVLWLSGPPPAGLRLHLPEGERHSAPDARATILPEYPAWFSGPGNAIALSAVLERGHANRALSFLLHRWLVDELRTRRAVAYSPEASYRPVNGETGLLYAYSDLVAGQQSDGVRPFCAALERLGDPAAIADSDLEDWQAALARERTEPMAALGAAIGNAFELVHGNAPIEPEEQLAQTAAVTVADVAAAARAALATALVCVPDRVRVSREPWVPAPVTTFPALTGRTRHLIGQPTSGDTLVLAREGITLRGAGGQHISVPVDAVVAVQRWEDGRRVLVGSDSNRIVVEPTLWEDGADLAGQVDALMPAAVQVDMGARRPDEIPQPKPAPVADPVVADGRPVWERTGPKVVFGLFLVLAVFFLVAAAAMDQPAVAIGGAVFGYSAHDLRKKAKREVR